MKQELQNKLALFAANTQGMKKEFNTQDAVAKRFAAMLYALENKPVDCAALRESYDLIKSSTRAFSIFRGNMALCVVAMLSLKDDREALFDNTAAVYEMMKGVKFRASDYLAVAAYQIASNASPEQYQETVARARAFYDGMKANGFFRTGEDDYIFAAMLGLSDINVKEGTDRIEQFYKRFKPYLKISDSVQALAQILVLSGDSDTAAARLLELRDALKAEKLRLDKTFTMSSLGILALLPVEIGIITQDIKEAQAFLRTQKGFGSFSIDKQELLILAAGIVASVYAGDVENGVLKASLSTSIASVIIAQQTAFIAAMAASSAAVAASASS